MSLTTANNEETVDGTYIHFSSVWLGKLDSGEYNNYYNED